MKNLKKVLAFVVVFAMMLSVGISASPFPDVDDSDSYAEAATILNSLGLMIGDDEGNFNPDKTIIRSEATTVVVRAKGLGDAADGAKGPTKFGDVDVDSWATGFINIAQQSGMVEGYNANEFGPNDEVTYEQYVKMLVAALGYTPMANTLGGYPTGYLVIAAQKNITTGAAGSVGQPATRKVVARLTFNALEVNMMGQKVFTAGLEEYEEITDTLLKTYLGITKYEGTVVETYASSATSSNTKKHITIAPSYIDGSAPVLGGVYASEKILEGKTDAVGLLGFYVSAYAKEDELTGDLTMIAIAKKQSRNEEISLDYSQLEDYNWTTGRITYKQSSSSSAIKTVTLSDNVKYFYNGIEDEDNAKLFIENSIDKASEISGGNVLFLVDASGLGTYVFVTEYTASYVVGSISASSQRLADKNGNNIPLYMDDDDVTYTFLGANGETLSFDDIKVDDVLTFAESDDETLVTVYVTNETVTGKVNETRTYKNEDYYTIGGNEFRLGNSSSGSISLTIGEEGTFYLNADGRIVFKETTRTTVDNYAYLVAAEIETGIGGETAQLKFITAAGEWKIATLATTVTVYEGDARGVSKKPITEEIGSANPLYTIGADGKVATVNQQLFLYNTNSSGQINRIDIIGSSTLKYEDSYFTMDYSSDSATYTSSNKKLGSVYVDDATIIFNIKKVEGNIASETDEKRFSVSTAKSLLRDTVSYDVKAYDIVDDYPTVVVVGGAEAGVVAGTKLFVLKSVTSTTNDSGSNVMRLIGYQDGEEVSALTSEDLAITSGDLNPGDVIIFNLDAKGDIDEYELLISAEEANKGFDSVKIGSVEGVAAPDETRDTFGLVVAKSLSSNRVDIAFENYWTTAANGMLQVRLASTPGNTVNVYKVAISSRGEATASVSDFNSITTELREGSNRLGSWIYVREVDNTVVDAVYFTFANGQAYEADAPA